MKLSQRTRTRTSLSVKRRRIAVTAFSILLAFGLIVMINISDNRKGEAATSGDYRSVTSGNWNSISTWETYNGAAWVAASVTPSSTDGVIEIQNGHVVTVTAGVTVDQVLIDAGGEVDVNSGVTLTFANGTGTDLDCSGILKKTGTLTVNASATLAFESGSTYKENKNGDAIPVATWNTGSTIEVTGVTTTVPSNLNQSFYNFKWNSTSQTAAINMAGNLTTVNGDFTVSSTGSSELDISNTANFVLTIAGGYTQSGGTVSLQTGNGKKSTINIGGNWNHTGGTLTVGGNTGTNGQVFFTKSGTQTFTASGNTVSGWIDFTINSVSTLDIGTSTLICNAFNAPSGSTMSIGATTGLVTSGGSANIKATGAIILSPNSNYILYGSAAQVSGSGFPSSVNNLTINNSSGVTLTAGVTVGGTLTLTSGKVTTGSYELNVSNASTSAIAGYSSSSYVFGLLRRSVSASGSYNFPVGSSAYYEPASVSLSSITGFVSILASFTNANPIDPSYPLSGVFVNGTPITDMLDYGYWTLTPNIAMTGGTYSVTLNEQGYSNPGSTPMAYGVLKRANPTSSWQSLGNHDNSTQSESGGIASATRTGLTSFSNFGIGKGSGALPITLVSFDAKPAGNQVKLTWATANEINNDFFTVERSSDGKTFLPLLKRNGAGNSTSMHHYDAKDESPLSGIGYYRLKQTDYDGKFTYSGIRSVKFDKTLADDAIKIESVGPNPFTESFSLTYSVQQDGDVDITLLSNSGKEVYHKKENAEKGTNRFDYNESNLSAGVYFLRIVAGDKAQTQRIIKQ